MYFTREPIIESVVTPASGYKLILKPSSHTTSIEYRVEAVEIVSFPGGLFYRNIEGAKTFLVPAKDYEIVEVRESRISLKLSSQAKEDSSVAKTESQATSKKKKRSRSSKKREKVEQDEVSEEKTAPKDDELQEVIVSEDSSEKKETEQSLANSEEQTLESSKKDSEQVEESSSESAESSQEKPKRRARRTQRRPRSPRKNTSKAKNEEPSDVAEQEKSTGEKAQQLQSAPSLVIPPPPGLVSDILSYEKIPNKAIKEVESGSSPLEASIQTKPAKESKPDVKSSDLHNEPILEFSVED